VELYTGKLSADTQMAKLVHHRIFSVFDMV